ncbi:MAG TPA: DUF6282 family protein [Candidatus Dormibacteraeota bacterium]|jgi:hypothetical protein|nr:DUF6282 family protein [Candidatus Dormibacteraeota bacterium]
MSELNRSPSTEAWEAIRGALDLHVHVGPDVIQRRIDDVDLAAEFRDRGLAGFVLKSHYVPTAERAAAVRRAVPEVRALGALALNHSVGGLNPAALEVSARLGARVVWMPTVDAANEWRDRSPDTPPAAWGAFHERLRGRPSYPPPISLLGPDGRLRGVVDDCLEVIAAYDLVLATGHVGRQEIQALVPRARQLGVSRIVVTHVEFPSLALTAEEQVELARQGAVIEHCYTTAYTGKTSWEQVFANIRATGPEVAVISTDLGQVGNPPVATGLADFAERLLRAGFSAGAVRRMAVDNPSLLMDATAPRTTTSP